MTGRVLVSAVRCLWGGWRIKLGSGGGRVLYVDSRGGGEGRAGRGGPDYQDLKLQTIMFLGISHERGGRKTRVVMGVCARVREVGGDGRS